MVGPGRPVGERREPATAGQPPAQPAPADHPARSGALGWAGGILALRLLLAASWAFTRYLHAPRAAESPSAPQEVLVQPPPTIAVLPLVDMSPSAGTAYPGHGPAPNA